MVWSKVFGWGFTILGLLTVFFILPNAKATPRVPLTIIFIGIVLFSIGIFLLKL
jgi:predicted membrane channel-forming protein YqfA (hemolysin III family)